MFGLLLVHEQRFTSLSDWCCDKLIAMKNPLHEKTAPIQPFQSGQIWQMENSHVRIGNVGKTLVEYKVLKGEVKRGPIRLSPKTALQEFLTVRNAVLVQ